MPYRELILFSYFIQGSHAFLSALHIWLIMDSQTGLVFNTIMAGFNALAFLNAANWRARLRAYVAWKQRSRDFFRR